MERKRISEIAIEVLEIVELDIGLWACLRAINRNGVDRVANFSIQLAVLVKESSRISVIYWIAAVVPANYDKLMAKV